MDRIAFIACLLLIFACGYALLCAALGKQAVNAPLLLGLSWTLGSGLIPVLLMIASLLGRVPDRVMLVVVAASAAIALFITFRKRRFVKCEWRSTETRSGWLGWTVTLLAVAVIAAAVGSVALESTMPGLPDTDAFAIWTLKAKLVSTSPLRPIPVLLTDPTLSFSHQDYPLGLPLLTAAVHACTGWPIETCAQSLLVPIFAAMVLVVFGTLRTLVNRPLALAVTAVLVAGPSLVSLAGTTEAELPLLLQHTATLGLLLLWMRQGGRGWLIAAGTAAVFTALTKNEGLALLPILGVAAIIFALIERSTRRLRDACSAVFVAIILISPWIVYRSFLPHTHEDYGGRLANFAAVFAHADQLPKIARALGFQLINFAAVGGLWVLLPVCAIIGWRATRQPAVLVLWFVLVAHIGLYVLVFMVTPWELDTLLPMVSPKLMMHVSPAALLLIGLYAAAIDEPASAAFPLPVKDTKTPAMAGPLQ